jgi:PilZ domain-containing protein
MPESRNYPRMRVLKGAKIILGTSSVLDCVVRDLTNGGARVKIPNAVDLPEEFAITFDGGRTCRPCRVAWRTLNETGLEFSSTNSQPSAA